MSSVSKAQQRLMAAAEHGADFPMAKKIRKSMSHEQMHDFAVGSMKDKPEHAAMAHHVKSLKAKGKSEYEATKAAIQHSATPKAKAKGHPNRHKNLGNYLHTSKKIGS